MRLGQRVAELEHQAGVNEPPMLLIVREIVGVDNTKTGPERRVRRDPIGLTSAMRDGRSWPRLPGESIEAMIQRVWAELEAEGRKVYSVCEEYEA